MNAIFLTLFVGAVLTAFALFQFAAAWRRKEHDQVARLSLLPLAGDAEWHPAADEFFAAGEGPSEPSSLAASAPSLRLSHNPKEASHD